MSTLLPVYVLLDPETTGTTPAQGRIIETGLIRYENGVEAGRWSTLINHASEHPAFHSAPDRHYPSDGYRYSGFCRNLRHSSIGCDRPSSGFAVNLVF